MVAAIVFSNTYWTFWDVFLLFFLFIPMLMLWFFSLIDVIRRHDLSGWAKAAWVVGILVFAWIGTLAYVIFRPWGEGAPAYSGGMYGYGAYGPYGSYSYGGYGPYGSYGTGPVTD